MKLGAWLKERGLSQMAYSRMSGIPQSQIARFVLDRRLPNRRHMQKIVESTEGAVTPLDFYDIALPTQVLNGEEEDRAEAEAAA